MNKGRRIRIKHKIKKYNFKKLYIFLSNKNI